MAQTWGDIIGRNYMTGRAIGNDFSSTRFAKKAAALRDQYEERARAENRPLTDFLPEIEQELQQLAIDTGVTRRNVRSERGIALDDEFASNVGVLAIRDSERRAGALAMGGDQAGARDMRARGFYGYGNFDEGQNQQIAGGQIRATQGAVKDGEYNQAAGAQALALNAANFGLSDEANRQQQGATTFRLQAGGAAAGEVWRIAQNIDKFSNDDLAGAWAGMVEFVPELARFRVQKDDENPNMIHVFDGAGKAIEAYDMSNQDDKDELAGMLSEFTRDPSGVLGGYMQGRVDQFAKQQERDTEMERAFRNARIEVVKNLAAAEIPASFAEKLVSANQAIGGNGGMQLVDIGTDPGNYLVSVNGQRYIVEVNQEADLENGRPGGTVVVKDLQGNPVPPDAINGQQRQQLAATLSELTAETAGFNYAQKVEVLRTQLQLLGDLEANYRGGAGAGGAPSGIAPATGALGGEAASESSGPGRRRGPATRPGRRSLDVTGTVQELYDTFPGAEVTSGRRSAERNAQVDGAKNSFHLTGEAIDIRPANAKQRAEIVSWAKANGWEVHTNYGDGHVHLEPPSRGMAINPVGSVDSLAREAFQTNRLDPNYYARQAEAQPQQDPVRALYETRGGTADFLSRLQP